MNSFEINFSDIIIHHMISRDIISCDKSYELQQSTSNNQLMYSYSGLFEGEAACYIA